MGPLYMLLTFLPAIAVIAFLVWVTVALSDIRRELRLIRQAVSERTQL